MVYDNLTVERDGQIAVVTLNRPEKLNAIDRTLHLEMMAAGRELRDDDGVRAVIFTGAGRGFCSGADLTADRSRPENPPRGERLDEYNWVGRQALMIYRELDKPTIAAVNGVAAGAGMGLALACDLRVGCENTRFKTVFIERSLSPDSGLSWFLPRIVGVSRAMDLVYTSRNVDAEEAWRLGLLDRMSTAENLLATPRSWPGKSRSGRRWRCRCRSGPCNAAWTPTWTTSCSTRRIASCSRGGRRTTWRKRRRHSGSGGRRTLRANRMVGLIE